MGANTRNLLPLEDAGRIAQLCKKSLRQNEVIDSRESIADFDVSLSLGMRSLAIEQAARTLLPEAVAQFLPRIEEGNAVNARSFVLDLAGCELLFGPATKSTVRLAGRIPFNQSYPANAQAV